MPDRLVELRGWRGGGGQRVQPQLGRRCASPKCTLLVVAEFMKGMQCWEVLGVRDGHSLRLCAGA
jgi:hypothetical protein